MRVEDQLQGSDSFRPLQPRGLEVVKSRLIDTQSGGRETRIAFTSGQPILGEVERIAATTLAVPPAAAATAASKPKAAAGHVEDAAAM
jgi:hypothetical protein